jgi:hypothetical protein
MGTKTIVNNRTDRSQASQYQVENDMLREMGEGAADSSMVIN